MLDSLGALFVSGRVFEAIIALTVLEGAALTVYARRTARGIAPGQLWPNLLAGIALMLALRVSSAGVPWMPVAACLLAALLAHLLDLSARWR